MDLTGAQALMVPVLVQLAAAVTAVYLLGCAAGDLLRRLVGSEAQAHYVAPAPRSTEILTTTRIKTTPTQELAARLNAAERTIASPRQLPLGDTFNRLPSALSQPRFGRRDNLKLIKGIGPGIERGLNDLGVYHFDQVAGWTDTAVRLIEAHFAFPGRIGREGWVQQARMLADRDETRPAMRA